jgi:hypothetical protein
LLSSSDFGVVVMAWLVTGFAGIFHDFGTKAAVIQRRELPSALLDSVFWLNVGIGIVIVILIALLAFVIAVAMREPQLTGVLWLLALGFRSPALTGTTGLLERAAFPVGASRFCAAFAGPRSASSPSAVGACTAWIPGDRGVDRGYGRFGPHRRGDRPGDAPRA